MHLRLWANLKKNKNISRHLLFRVSSNSHDSQKHLPSSYSITILIFVKQNIISYLSIL